MIFAALLYLGVERGRRVPRAALQEMFFPNVDERSGSHSVRQLLYKLRQLGAPITANDSAVSIDSTQIVDDCLLAGARTWSDAAASVAALGFLPEYKPNLSERFEEWLENQRTAVGGRLRTTLVDLILQRKARSDWAGVASISQSLLSADPLNEEATLALAEALAVSGGKHKAISMLSTYEVETGATLRLAPSLLRRRISDALYSASETPRTGKLVGRSEELGMLGKRARQSQSSHITLVAGDAGIGKSRLLEELVLTSSIEGIRPFVVRCRPHHLERPLSVFIELVPEMLQSPGALGVNPDSLKCLQRLVHTEADNHTSGELDDISKSELLTRALFDLFDAVCSEQQCLLVVEDLHWCDKFSLAKLRLTASRFPSVPIIASTRSVDHVRTHFEGVAEVVRLQPLAAQDMSSIVAEMLGNEVDEGTKTWSIGVAAGNPLFLRMLCCHVRQTGVRSVPGDLTAVISSRLVLLEELYLRAIQYVALLGSYCTLSSLRELLGLSHSEFIDCVARLEDQSYLALRHNTICLNHDLVSDISLALASPVTKRALHAHVAAYLEKRFEQSGVMAVLWDCTEQWRLSGEPAKSTQLLRRCASHASALGHSGQAFTILTYARQHVHNDDLAVLLDEMLVAARAAGQLDDVISIGRDLAQLTQTRHSESEMFAIEADWLINGKVDVDHLWECLSESDATIHHRFEACLVLQRYAYEFCDSSLANKAYSAIVPLMPKANSLDRLLVEVIHHSTLGDISCGLQAIDELTALAAELPQIGDQLKAARNIVVGLLVFGRTQEAIACADLYQQRAIGLGLSTRQYEFGALAAACYLAMDDFVRAEERLLELGPPPDRYLVSLHNMLAIELGLWRGESVGISRLYDELNNAAAFRLPRNESYLRGAELRWKQLDDKFVCSDTEFQTYLNLYERTKSFLSDDGLVRALAEDLRRRIQPQKALKLLNDYALNSRKQCRVLTPSFQEFRARLESIAANFAA
jgi:DNA-binding SARP family transcriptional activator